MGDLAQREHLLHRRGAAQPILAQCCKRDRPHGQPAGRADAVADPDDRDLRLDDRGLGTHLPAEGATAATAGPHQVGHVEAYRGLVLYSVYTGYVGGNETLHVLDPATGSDAVVAKVKGFGVRAWAIGSRGLVYALNPQFKGPGKLVFVPRSRLLALAS